MDELPGNPRGNTLPPGLSTDQVEVAIRSSGYPLQQRVVATLTSSFDSLREEWGYIDRDTNTYRTLDLVATEQLWMRTIPKKGRFVVKIQVRPSLVLLIECVQTVFPYVFFRSVSPVVQRGLPLVAGLRHAQLELSARDTRDKFVYDIPHVLGLTSLPFIKDPPAICHTFSGLARKGNKVELTGSETFNKVIQPLIKAALYFETISQPRSSFRYLTCSAVVPVAVLDAPMLIVDVKADRHTTSYAPWVRVLRNEPVPGAQTLDTHRTFAIDCVHWEYLPEYLTAHLAPFSAEFAARVERHHKELYNGRGNLTSEQDSWQEDIEPHLAFQG
jgi:hypothetical protein